MSSAKLRLLTLGLVILAAGCSDEATSPFQPNVVNDPNTFAVQAGGLTNASATEAYTWQNPGTTADVGQSGVLTSGSASLEVVDAVGTTVYASDLAMTGTFSTAEGMAGAWTIRLVLANCSGDIDFSLQTP